MEWMFLVGVATGMRSMTPMAVLCWFAWSGMLHVQDTWGFWTAKIVSVIVFTAFAMGEYVGDTLPSAPNRTGLFPAGARIVFGALAGAIMGAAYLEPIAGGLLFGGLGAVVGTWGGFFLRRSSSRFLGRDLPVALAESALALAFALYGMYSFVHISNRFPIRYMG